MDTIEYYGRQLPNIEFADCAGNKISLWDYRDRENIAAAVLDSQDIESPETLAFLQDAAKEVAELNTKLLLVIAGDNNLGTANVCRYKSVLPIYSSEALIQLLDFAEMPYGLLLDKYGFLVSHFAGNKGLKLLIEEMLEELKMMDKQCPECGGDVWNLNPIPQ